VLALTHTVNPTGVRILRNRLHHRRGYKVVAEFIGGELSKVAQTVSDWAAKVFGKDLHTAKHKEKPGRGR